MCVPAPACKAALAEATKLWPNRRRSSDGICPSAAHTKANPKSGHERGEAFDVSHDPAAGCDAHAMAERVMVAKDPRILYVISRRRIWSRARWNEGWRPYSGSNPHDSHAHFELDPAHRNSTWSWWKNTTPPNPQQPSTPAAFVRIESRDIDVTVNTYTLALTTDGEGRGWDVVPFTRSRIVGFTPPGLRPGVDGRYLVGQVGFADDAGKCVVSVTEWAPNTTCVLELSVIN